MVYSKDGLVKARTEIELRLLQNWCSKCLLSSSQEEMVEYWCYIVLVWLK